MQVGFSFIGYTILLLGEGFFLLKKEKANVEGELTEISAYYLSQ